MASSANYFFNEAKKESLKSEMNHKHGCIIVKNNKIVSRGHNHYILKNSLKKYSIHAEEDAIKNFQKQIPKNNKSKANIQIYIARCNGNKFKNSKPCKNCRNLITYLEPSKIIYTLDENKAIVEFL